jgi:hypothetical protein
MHCGKGIATLKVVLALSVANMFLVALWPVFDSTRVQCKLSNVNCQEICMRIIGCTPNQPEMGAVPPHPPQLPEPSHNHDCCLIIGFGIILSGHINYRG